MRSLFDHIQFNVTFPSVPVPVVGVWRILVEYLQQQKSLPKNFEIALSKTTDRLRLSPEAIEMLIDKENREEFLVNSGKSPRGIQFWLYHAKNLGPQSTLQSTIENQAIAPNEWGGMIESLMRSFPSIGGWQWRGPYKAWQDANCIEKCYEELYGLLPPGFRTWKEPPSHPSFPELTLIDISLNPGRSKQLCPYSYFHPTAEMWLGRHFWQYAKCTKEEVISADFFIEKRDTSGYLYLKCWPTAFTRPDGDQGRMQQRLWKLFFHEDCEWPPGSGTICDEPMYGPPELMPDYKPPSDPL